MLLPNCLVQLACSQWTNTMKLLSEYNSCKNTSTGDRYRIEHNASGYFVMRNSKSFLCFTFLCTSRRNVNPITSSRAQLWTTTERDPAFAYPPGSCLLQPYRRYCCCKGPHILIRVLQCKGCRLAQAAAAKHRGCEARHKLRWSSTWRVGHSTVFCTSASTESGPWGLQCTVIRRTAVKSGCGGIGQQRILQDVLQGWG